MKNLFALKFSMLLCFSLFVISQATSQQYHSIPTAIKNLEDEESYVDHLITNELQVGTPEYTAAIEKRRFINVMLNEINKDSDRSLQNIADRFLPKENLNKLQVGVKYFNASHTGTTSNIYIRSELMSLISY